MKNTMEQWIQEKLDEQCNRVKVDKLIAFAWPGGYPVYYLDSDCSVLCPKCATKAYFDPEEDPRFKPIHGDVYYEGPSMGCDGCNSVIESAYGDPEEERNRLDNSVTLPDTSSDKV
jgi:hypothetical protein